MPNLTREASDLDVGMARKGGLEPGSKRQVIRQDLAGLPYLVSGPLVFPLQATRHLIAR
jgi:hypothetical protein